jgi:hypothetical protein
MSAKRDRTEDGQDTGSRLEISAEHEVGRDPYAIHTLDDVAKDEWDESEVFDGLESTLGMSENDEDEDRAASSSIDTAGETSAYDRAQSRSHSEDDDSYVEERSYSEGGRSYSADLAYPPDEDDESETSDDEPVTDDNPHMGAVWASESINAPLFHAAELRHSQADTHLPWELADPARADSDKSTEAMDERRKSSIDSRRISRPPPLPDSPERKRSRTASAALELESQEVVYEGRFLERRSVRRAGQVALASLVGIVLGWMAWGGPNKPPTSEESENTVASEPIVAPLDAGSEAPEPDAGAEGDSGETEDDTVAAKAPVIEQEVQAEPSDAGAVAADDTCAVLIHSKPSGASVWRNDQAIGKTPYRGKQPCGKSIFVVKRDNYKPLEIVRRLRDDGLNKINLELERPSYRVTVTSSPSRAVVRVNGKKVGRTPVAVRLPGYTKAKFTIDKPGHRTWKRTMVPRESNAQVKATLAPSKNKKKKAQKRRQDG